MKGTPPGKEHASRWVRSNLRMSSARVILIDLELAVAAAITDSASPILAQCRQTVRACNSEGKSRCLKITSSTSHGTIFSTTCAQSLPVRLPVRKSYTWRPWSNFSARHGTERPGEPDAIFSDVDSGGSLQQLLMLLQIFFFLCLISSSSCSCSSSKGASAESPGSSVVSAHSIGTSRA